MFAAKNMMLTGWPNPITGLSPWQWWKADAITGKSNGDALDSWVSSCAAATLGNSRSAEYPTYTAAGIGGLPEVTFNGANRLATEAVTKAQPVTIFTVAKNTSAATTNRQILSNGLTTPTVFLNIGVWAVYAGTIVATAFSQDTSPHISTAVFNGTSSKFYLDGVATGTINPGASGWSSKRVFVGCDAVHYGSSMTGAAPWIGSISEIVICPLLTDSEIAQVNTHLSQKYGIAIA